MAAHAHKLSLDQPLGVVRMGYTSRLDSLNRTSTTRDFEPVAIVPFWNMRGQPGLGAFADGTWRKCMPDAHCVNLAWPEMWAGYARPKWERSWWHGTLLEDKADASGLSFRRNRYYDPVNGRFTQEDPIGLAGGLNVYGFAAGDPVNYWDPFGLAVCFRGTGSEIRRLVRDVERAIDARVGVGLDGCVTRVTNGSGTDHQAQFEGLVRSVHTFTIMYGRDGSNYKPGTRTIELDPEDRGARFWAWRGGRCVRNAGRASLPQVMAHELGHAYQHNHGYPALATRRTLEYNAIYWENGYQERTGGRMRCRYADEW